MRRCSSATADATQSKPRDRLPRTNAKQILDGELLWRYVCLEASQQKELARQIGTTADQILDNLLMVDLSTLFF